MLFRSTFSWKYRDEDFTSNTDIAKSVVIDMNEQNEDEASVKSEHVNCSNVFNTSQVLI